MHCMFCNSQDSKVIDSRPVDEGNSIRRRRECLGCGRRFTTYEKIEQIPMMVVKRDGSRELFDAEKVRRGIVRSCEKLPVSVDQIETITAHVEQQVYSSTEAEIATSAIGDMVMDELRRINDVAYVRFAAVYRQFTDISSFMDELQKLVDEHKTKPQA